MISMKQAVTFGALGMLVAGLGVGLSRASEPNGAAVAFLATLDEAAKAKCVLPFPDDYRTNFRYVPAERTGIALNELGEASKKALEALLKSSLSQAGYTKVQEIQLLETVLREMGEPASVRDPNKYVTTFFGKPSATEPWAWRYEGHHVSLNFTYLGQRLVSSTPQFLGTNPAEVRTGSKKGLRVLGDVEDLGYRLLDSLSAKQREKAVLMKSVPADIITSNARKVAALEDLGIRYPDLDANQQAMLLDLVAAHAEVQTKAVASARLATAKREASHLVFAWIGSAERGKPHYYRIQSASFLIELDNTQNEANHVHTVWRNFDGDFGDDVLKDHYVHSHDHVHR